MQGMSNEADRGRNILVSTLQVSDHMSEVLPHEGIGIVLMQQYHSEHNDYFHRVRTDDEWKPYRRIPQPYALKKEADMVPLVQLF